MTVQLVTDFVICFSFEMNDQKRTNMMVKN